MDLSSQYVSPICVGHLWEIQDIFVLPSLFNIALGSSCKLSFTWDNLWLFFQSKHFSWCYVDTGSHQLAQFPLVLGHIYQCAPLCKVFDECFSAALFWYFLFVLQLLWLPLAGEQRYSSLLHSLACQAVYCSLYALMPMTLQEQILVQIGGKWMVSNAHTGEGVRCIKKGRNHRQWRGFLLYKWIYVSSLSAL